MNSRVISIVCLSLLIVRSPALCQDGNPQETNESRMSLAGAVGINDYHQRDKYLSPYIFNGLNFASRLSFLVQSEESRHAVDAFFSYGALDSDIQPRFVREHVGSLSYSYVRSIGTLALAGRPLRFFLGGGISSFLLFTDFNTTNETGYTTYGQSWYWSHSLNVVLAGGYAPGAAQNVTVRLTTPVAALVSRPENERWMNPRNAEVTDNVLKAATQGKMEYFWDNFVLFTDIEYRHSLSASFDLLASYRFGYVSSARPATSLSMGMYMNNLMVGISWSM